MHFSKGPDYLRLPRDPQAWLIQDLVPAGGFCNLYGAPKAGKTFAALGMALAISNGERQWLGFSVHAHGPVVYLQLDMTRTMFGGYLLDIAEGGTLEARMNGTSTVKPVSMENMHFADMLMTDRYPFNITDPLNIDSLMLALAEVKPLLVIIDTIREVHSSDENDSGAAKILVTSIVRATTPAAVMLVSHSKKDTNFGDLMTDARGSGYVAGRMDSVIRLTARTLTYKGRSAGTGDKKVRQNEVGMLELDGHSKTEYDNLAATVDRMLLLDPKTTQTALAAAYIAELTALKAPNIPAHRTACKRVSDYLTQLAP